MRRLVLNHFAGKQIRRKHHATQNNITQKSRAKKDILYDVFPNQRYVYSNERNFSIMYIEEISYIRITIQQISLIGRKIEKFSA